MYHQRTGIFAQMKGKFVGVARHCVAALVKVVFSSFKCTEKLIKMGTTQQN
jgi:hypothetical protein